MKKQDQTTNDLIWASSHYLCESLPNNFTNWNDKKLDKLRRMIQKIKKKYPRWDIFKIVKEAQKRIK